jgi:hypothetical protein
VILPTRLARSALRVVGIGAGPSPRLPDVAVPVEEWGLPEPEGRPLLEIRVICDTTRRLVTKLVARLDTEAAVRSVP